MTLKPTATVHCFFEQSGTFKNQFRKLGYNAIDYDIQNMFGETDRQIDLFSEIEKAYGNQPSVFDDITRDDLIMSFFPCTYFSGAQAMFYEGTSINFRNMSKVKKYSTMIERMDNRHKFYIILNKLYAVCDMRGLRLVIENPATAPSYIVGWQNFPKPTIIDSNRALRGDHFTKPTAYWFVNCEPTFGESYSPNYNVRKINNIGHSDPIARKMERSMIAPEYAKNFIADFILGKQNENTYPSLFD